MPWAGNVEPLMPLDVVREPKQLAVRLVLQPEFRIRFVIVVRSVADRNGLSTRTRSRRSNGLKVPWMKDGPALLPSASVRVHLASMKGSNASLMAKCASRLRLIRLSRGRID